MKFTQAKICLLGDIAVGKTSLVRRFVEGQFDDQYLSTIGVKISRKMVELDAYQVNLILWDLTGEDRFATYQDSYLRGASGAILVCDLARHETLEPIVTHAQQVRLAYPNAALVFVGNKVDLENKTIHEEELQQISSSFMGSCHLTSAKTGEKVETVFRVLAEDILRR